MIADTIKNNRVYHSLHPEFRKAFRFLLRKDLTRIPCGKHLIGRRGTYAIVQEYLTKKPEEGVIECHRRYIDIQFVVSGIETIGVCNKTDCKAGRYDRKKDFQPLRGTPDFITLRAGSFAVFFPHDGHMPCLMRGRKSEKVRKVVVKVPVITP